MTWFPPLPKLFQLPVVLTPAFPTQLTAPPHLISTWFCFKFLCCFEEELTLAIFFVTFYHFYAKLLWIFGPPRRELINTRYMINIYAFLYPQLISALERVKCKAVLTCPSKQQTKPGSDRNGTIRAGARLSRILGGVCLRRPGRLCQQSS